MGQQKLLLLVSNLFILLADAASPQVKVVPQLAFPVEGSPFRVDCYADGSEDMTTPTIMFENADNMEMKNTSTRFIMYSTNASAFTAKASMVWPEITLKHMATKAEQGSSCKVANTNHAFKVFVLPKHGVPRISVSPQKPFTGERGKNISFECHAFIDIQEKVTNMTMSWKTGNETHLVPIPQSKRAKMEYRSEMKSVSLLMASRLTLHDLDEESVGNYFCIGDMHVKTARGSIVKSGDLFYKKIELEKVIDPPKTTAKPSSSSRKNLSNLFFLSFLLLVVRAIV